MTDEEIRAVRPNAVSTTNTEVAVVTPRVEASAARRPWAMPRLTMKIRLGPGSSTRAVAAAAKASRVGAEGIGAPVDRLAPVWHRAPAASHGFRAGRPR